jgi:hypothetical protein
MLDVGRGLRPALLVGLLGVPTGLDGRHVGVGVIIVGGIGLGVVVAVRVLLLARGRFASELV